MRRCLKDIGQEQKGPTELRCDNQGAIALSGNPVFHSQTKHIEVSHHLVREVVESREIELSYVRTIENWADILTKPLPAAVHNYHCQSLGLMGTKNEGEHTKTVSVPSLTKSQSIKSQ